MSNGGHFKATCLDGVVLGENASYITVDRSKVKHFSIVSDRLLWKSDVAPLIYRRRVFQKGPGQDEEVLHVVVMPNLTIHFIHESGRIYSSKRFGQRIPFHPPEAVTPEEVVILSSFEPQTSS